MKWLLVSVVCLFCVSCARSHDIRPAVLAFDSISSGHTISGYYLVRFHSDTELLELFAREKNARSFDQVFVCALADDTDFSVGHTMAQAAMGLIEENRQSTPGSGFDYLARVSFRSHTDRYRSSEYLSKSALKGLLQGKQSIPCKVVVMATGYKAYYTRSLFMPVAEILSVLKADGAE
ncbi:MULTISPECIES: hypothetical protein [unclassified Pseudomonas]|uniref:hypothetical protein n=1 Tax=unclassified Pseudomonas TaxID=196821 RepID=UPI0021146C2F|nr:hypothetical protein [Pseudomonas sp. MPR-ANC1]